LEEEKNEKVTNRSGSPGAIVRRFRRLCQGDDCARDARHAVKTGNHSTGGTGNTSDNSGTGDLSAGI
jgi:hypothetical protein